MRAVKNLFAPVTPSNAVGDRIASELQFDADRRCRLPEAVPIGAVIAAAVAGLIGWCL
jgi:hypothetical protein